MATSKTEYQRNYREKNRDTLNAKRREYYQRKKTNITQYNKNWVESHPEYLVRTRKRVLSAREEQKLDILSDLLPDIERDTIRSYQKLLYNNGLTRYVSARSRASIIKCLYMLDISAGVVIAPGVKIDR